MHDDTEDVIQWIEGRAFVEARRRVMRRLVESLLYEGIVAADVRPQGDGQVFSIPGVDAEGQPVAYVAHGTKRPSFDRIRLAPEPVRRISASGAAEAESVTTFLLELRPRRPIELERLATFITEAEQTVLKDAQSIALRDRSARLRELGYDALEAGLSEGHPYHPSYKSRVGFTLEDNRRFGPELGPTLRPTWVALHTSCAVRAVSRRSNAQAFLEAEVGEATLQGWKTRLAERGHDPADYVFLPVHPWQWERHIVPTMFEEVRAGTLVPLDPTTDVYTPQQSIRTLANASRRHGASLKFSLSILNTSTSRILAPHTVQNAPAISDWLCSIAEGDELLREEWRPVFLREVLGVAYAKDVPEPLHARSYGVLSCIWRESVHAHLDPGEAAMPWSALCHLDRDGRPIVDPWIAEHGVEPWLRRLLDVSVPPILHVLVAHGVGLESHAQNMILLHRGGWPSRVALKDFHDGVRFSPRHLAAPDAAPMLQATPARHVRVNRNSYVVTDRAEDVRDFVLDAFLFVNLSEIALFLAERYGLEETRFWAQVRLVVEAYRHRFPHLEPRFRLFDPFAPTLNVEKLTNRRLYAESEVQVHNVPSPLAVP